MEADLGAEPFDLELQARGSSFLSDEEQRLSVDLGQPFLMGYRFQLPSFADSTSYTSELSDPAYTQDSTLPTAYDDFNTHDPHPRRHEVEQDVFPQDLNDSSTHNLDLQGIGLAPQILVNGQLPRPPLLPAEEAFSTNLVANGYTTAFDGDCDLISALASREDVDRISSAGSSHLDMADTPSSSVGLSRTSSQSSARGRRRRLSREAREKAADMRNFRSCDRCRIRRVAVSLQDLRALLKV